MLKQIELINYRCFEYSKMSIRDISIIVGKNNSGKSTLIEALRMISMASKKCTNTTYVSPPKSLNMPITIRGFRLPVEDLKIDLRSVVHFYKHDIAKITATFRNGVQIIVYANKEVAFAIVTDQNGERLNSKNRAKEINHRLISILPQIGLIKENERLLTKDTITGNLDTYLSSRHFRNEILLYKNDYFRDFKMMAEATWPGLRIKSLEFDSKNSDYICLFIEDARFPAEIGLMGSGIQMWLQIIWFIARSKGSDTIILDEPDVYMHPDLQIRILKLVTSLFPQVIIATHSIEIISNVSPRNIVTIDKQDRQMRYANELNVVQDVINDIGSIYNLSLTKLNSAKKCLFVEGEDVKILQQFYNVLYPNSLSSLDTIPSLPLGGFKKIKEAFGAAKLFYDSSDGHFKCYAILDRDYYSERQIEEQLLMAKENHLILHVWNKKELENYIINPHVLFRLIKKTETQYKDFVTKYEELVDSFKEGIIDSYTTIIQENERNLAAGTAARKARELVNSKWVSLEGKLSIVPGKDLLKATNNWVKENYNVSCSIKRIFSVMKSEDIDVELIELIKRLTCN
ncbi:ATP-binding protein [Anaerospora sp.]|uniref:ATP-dependent nuclease n=1 Tax=Anaerospora sp. TaxID=1960278 RepID=UPI002898A03A|nr:ATP-binding protein [Anaerospora sp.]